MLYLEDRGAVPLLELAVEVVRGPHDDAIVDQHVAAAIPATPHGADMSAKHFDSQR